MAATLLDSTDVDHDWVAGDTVVASFGADNVLQRLEAAGHGRTRYRVFDGIGPARVLKGINYSRGDRIVARFTLDALERVDVSGHADGVYLEASAADSGAAR